MANRTIDGMRARSSQASPMSAERLRLMRRQAAASSARGSASVSARSVRSAAPATPRTAERPRRVVRKASPVVEKTTPSQPRQTREDFLKPVDSFDLDLSSEDIKPEKTRRRKEPSRSEDRPPKKKTKRRVLGVIAALLILVIGAGVVALVWGDSIISRITGGRSGIGELIGVVMGSEDVELKKDSAGRTNILVFGTSGYDMSGSDHDGAQLTDSIMVVSLDQKTKDMAMISLPRDLYLGNTCTSTGKINEVYWCGNIDDTAEAKGAAALADDVESIFGITLHYYVHLNWGALVQIVDTLGGITVTLDESIADYGWTNIVIQEGVPTTLDGEQALGLARARHGTEAGDFTRAASQQKILIALKDRIVQQGVSVTDAIGILNAVGDNVRTDFKMDEMKTLYNIGTSMDLAAMRSLSLLDQGDGTSLVATDMFDPGYLGYQVSYVVPAAGRFNYTEIRNFVKKQFSSDPVARENAKILILNGTGEYGVAGAEQKKLEEELGLTATRTGDAPEGYWQGYKLYDVTGATPGTLAKLAERYGVEASSNVPPEVTATGYDILVIIGVSGAEE